MLLVQKLIYIMGWGLSLLLYQCQISQTGMKVNVLVTSHVRLFVTSWTVACQAPLSMEFSRQEHWTG